MAHCNLTSPGLRTQEFPPLVAQVPVSDIRIGALTAGLVVGSQGVEIVFFAMRAGILVMIVVTPRVLAGVLQVAARAPVADRRIGRLLHEGSETLFRSRVFRVVELEHGKRGFEALYVVLGLVNARPFHLADDFWYDHGGQQADYDDDYHDLNQGEPACTYEADAAGDRRITNRATVRLVAHVYFPMYNRGIETAQLDTQIVCRFLSPHLPLARHMGATRRDLMWFQ
jgi:hypothetical protein